MGKYSRKYIGQEFTTNEGYTALVVDGGNKAGYCTIQIKDYIKEIAVCALKCRNVKYPFHPSVYSIGYLGDGKHTSRINSKLTEPYLVWHNMLMRCYGQKYQTNQPTYTDCTVSKEWHNYQVFSEWFERNYVERWALDKDLLVSGNKIYSKDICIFIPQCLNNFMTNNQSSNTSGRTGVSWDKQYNKWVAQINDISTDKKNHIGYFAEMQEASNAYKKARTTMAHRMKHKMILEYGITDLKILDAIDKL